MEAIFRGCTWILYLAPLLILIGGTPCDNALGMEDRTIIKDQLKVSSNPERAGNARLNANTAWRASQSDSNPWLQVTFSNPIYVTAIATQGSPENSRLMYTMQYKILYGLQEGNLSAIIGDHNIEKVFDGNIDSNTIVRRMFPNPLRLIFIRIVTTSCEGRCALRIELYGCEALPTSSTVTHTTERISTTPSTYQNTKIKSTSLLSTPTASSDAGFIKTLPTSSTVTHTTEGISTTSSTYQNTEIKPTSLSSTPHASSDAGVIKNTAVGGSSNPILILMATTSVSIHPETSHATSDAGVIVGSIIGGLIVLAVLVAVICFLKYCRRKSKKQREHDEGLRGSEEINELPDESSNFYTSTPRGPRHKQQQMEVQQQSQSSPNVYVGLSGEDAEDMVEQVPNQEKVVEPEVRREQPSIDIHSNGHETLKQGIDDKDKKTPRDKSWSPELTTLKEEFNSVTVGEHGPGNTTECKEEADLKVEADLTCLNVGYDNDDNGDDDGNICVIYNDAVSAFKEITVFVPNDDKPEEKLDIYSQSELWGRRFSSNIHSSQWGTWAVRKDGNSDDVIDEKSQETWIDNYDTYPFKSRKKITKRRTNLEREIPEDATPLNGEVQKVKTDTENADDDKCQANLHDKFNTYPFKTRKNEVNQVESKSQTNQNADENEQDVSILDDKVDDNKAHTATNDNQGFEDSGSENNPTRRVSTSEWEDTYF
ncbi:uncharacterized protein [Amphiura filiformis]|uniref:uncharacterized protein n=1 Tax=Amphiura filiformis TaxID=82378 RepID=UPI003B21852A